MPSYLYNIGDTYSSIQEAIDLIVSDMDNGWLPTQDITVNIQDGIYAGFSIPNGSLLPLLGTDYRLIIKSAGNYFPIIDFNNSDEESLAGADIGASNPNVQIKGIRIQYFPVGIRADLNSHNIKINNCIVSNNRNVGIFINECNNVQALQNIVVNGDYGIVSRLCKNISVIHNTIFLNGSLSNENGKAVSALWLQASRDYGSGLDDTGKIYVIGNILWNTVGTTLTVFSNDIETPGLLKSNYNDIVVGDPTKFISIEDDSTFYGSGTRPRRLLNNLTSWKSIGFDLDSKSLDPRFIVPVSITNNNKYSVDLNLLSISPVIGMVPSFFNDPVSAEEWLPSYIDTSDISRDILSNPRQQNVTSAGANDRASNRGFYGQDVLTSPISINAQPECGVSPLHDIIQKNLFVWYPSYKKGYFYSFDRKFYLYSRKECVKLSNIAVTKFNLPSRISTQNPILIKVNGKTIQSPNQFDIRGQEFLLYHKNLNLNSFEEEVDIEYYVPVWKDGKFSNIKTYIKFKINEGETKYFLPSYYIPEGPVVITDDTADLLNKDIFCSREFSIDFNHAEQLSEVKFFHNKNKIENSSFEYSFGESPKGWSSEGAVVTTGNNIISPIIGGYVCEISGGGYIEQILTINTGEHCLSFYSSSVDTSVLNYNFSFYDSYNRDLGYVITGSLQPNNYWERNYLNFGATGLSHIVPNEDYNTIYLNHIPLPEDSKYIKINFSSNTGSILLDGIQFEESSTPTAYHKKILPSEYTIEYETSDSQFFLDKNQNLSPSLSEISNGFVYIPEIPASCYDGPANPSITTFFEWKWPAGRINHIPWSRINGKDKLKERIRNSDYPSHIDTSTIYSTKIPQVKSIDIVPGVPITSPGDENGITFNINVSDSNGNPSANMKISSYIIGGNQEYPGLLHKRLLGLKEQLGQVCYGYTSHAGSFCLTWIPPSKEDSKLVLDSVPPIFYNSIDGEPISIVKTRYPVNLDYHGNVIILDSNGNKFNTKSSNSIRAIYSPVRVGDFCSIKLSYPIVPGTISVIIDGLVYTETLSGSPETYQFNVDYENSIVTIKGFSSEVEIEYTPSFIFINQEDPYKIMFYSSKIFGSYTGPITIGYDYTVKLITTVVDYSLNTTVSKDFNLLARNYLLEDKFSFNELALEF